MTPILLQIYGEMLAQQALMLGMQADNMQRAALGQSMAHTAADFTPVEQALWALAMQARGQL